MRIISEPEEEMIALKKEKIGQSILTAEISIWSGTNAKGGYAAAVIFSITLLATCLYVFLRETGCDRFLAGSGALLATLFPAVTRLSLNGFLSQASILFVFPFFASLLRHEDLSARRFTLFFSLTLAYIAAAYSEIAPIGLCTLFLGVMFVRRDKFRVKRLMFMSSILLIALMNPFYLRNLIEFLAQQYKLAANATLLVDHMAPKVLTLRGWSELIFGAITSASSALFFDYCAILLGLLFLAGAIFLSRRDRLICGAILLPVILVILYLATRTPPSYYPIAIITLTILPFVIGLVFVAPSSFAANSHYRPVALLTKLLCSMIVAAAAAGSVRYYSEVLNLLRFVREPRFLNVCPNLEEIKNKRVLVYETHQLLPRGFATTLSYKQMKCYFHQLLREHRGLRASFSSSGILRFGSYGPFSLGCGLFRFFRRAAADRAGARYHGLKFLAFPALCKEPKCYISRNDRILW